MRKRIAILVDMPMGRLFPEYADRDPMLTPWIYALYLALRGHEEYEIHWVTLKHYVTENVTLERDGMWVHVLPYGSFTKGVFTGHWWTGRRIRKVLGDIRPDLVHIWGIEQPYAMAVRHCKCAKLLSMQGALTGYVQRGLTGFYPQAIAFWERRSLPCYPEVTTESPWARDRVHEVAPQAHVTLVEYGTEQRFFDIQRQPEAEPNFFFAGTVYHLKGVEYLVEAFRSPELQHVKLYIAGSGNLVAPLQAVSTPNIIWLGQAPREVVTERLTKAWGVVHPTLADCCPNIVKEARVVGLPVVTTCEGGQTQYVVDGKSGFIVPIKDPEAIKSAVLKIAASLQTSLDMGAYDRERCRHALSVDRTVEGFLALYDRLLATGGQK